MKGFENERLNNNLALAERMTVWRVSSEELPRRGAIVAQLRE